MDTRGGLTVKSFFFPPMKKEEKKKRFSLRVLIRSAKKRTIEGLKDFLKINSYIKKNI